MKKSSITPLNAGGHKHNRFLYFQDDKYESLGPDTAVPMNFQIENLQTHSRRSVSSLELFGTPGKPKDVIWAATPEELEHLIRESTQPVLQVTSADLPASLVARAKKIMKTVQIVRALLAIEEQKAQKAGTKFSIALALKEICPRLRERACEVEKANDSWALLDREIGHTTYYKYLDICQRNNFDEIRMAISLRRRDLGQSRMSPAQIHFADTLILTYYARRPRVIDREDLDEIATRALERTDGRWFDPAKLKGTIPEDLIQQLLDTNIPMQAIVANDAKRALLSKIKKPSKGWLYSYVHWFEEDQQKGLETIDGRYGKDTSEHTLQVFDSFIHRAQRPGQYIFLDHWLIDCFTVDEASRRKLDRLWLTTGIDVYSRSIIGIALLNEAPCIESVTTFLRNAIWPKDLEKWGFHGKWVSFGIPQMLFLDNAWAHHSETLESLANEIGQGGMYPTMTLAWRPPYKGRYGALIERFFGNLSAQIRNSPLPGRIRSTDPKDVHSAAAEACLLYEDLYRWILERIIEYQNTPQDALAGMSPNEKWIDGCKAGLPEVPAWSPEIDRLFWRRSSKTRVIGRLGISIFGLHFSSPELKQVEKLGRNGKPSAFSVSSNPLDMSHIAVFRQGRYLCDAFARELLLPDNSYNQVSLAEMEIAKALASEKGQATRDWPRYLKEINELTRMRTTEQKRAQKTGVPNKVQRSEPTQEQIRAADEEMNNRKLNDNDLDDPLNMFVPRPK